MKVLYAIQTTGNGHLSRAIELLPFLKKRFNVAVILSGPPAQISLDIPIEQQYRGLTLYYTKKGAVHWIQTLIRNNIWRFVKEVFSLPVHQYDLVISDFEPVAAWAAKMRRVPCFGVSNQIALWQKGMPTPQRSFRKALRYLQYFAPTQQEYGLFYHKFQSNIFSPIIRDKVQKQIKTVGGGMVVYLPAYDLGHVITYLKKFPLVQWHVFSPAANQTTKIGTIHIHPVDKNHFTRSMAKADGVVTHAGFSTTSEALFLGKPLLVVPIKGQIEQTFNAAYLKSIGVCVFSKFGNNNLTKMTDWITNPKTVPIPFTDDTNALVDQISVDYIKIITARSRRLY